MEEYSEFVNKLISAESPSGGRLLSDEESASLLINIYESHITRAEALLRKKVLL